MSNITIDMIKELRQLTHVSIAKCKQELIKTQGNIELALQNMRKLGLLNQIAVKTNKITKEGGIFISIVNNMKYGVILELNCETDFVAKNSDFIEFGNFAINIIINNNIHDINLLKNKLQNEYNMLIAKFNENIDIKRFSILESNDTLGYYLHNRRIGVIVDSTSSDKILIKNIAMHITASKPEYIHEHDIPQEIIDREYNIQLDIVSKSGKSLEINKKIIHNRMQKFYDAVSLLNQPFVMDVNKSIAQLLNDYKAKINNFIRFEVGEKIKT